MCGSKLEERPFQGRVRVRCKDPRCRKRSVNDDASVVAKRVGKLLGAFGGVGEEAS
jgi:hypothetical protein